MAVTKILARKGRLDVGVRYVLNGDKTQEQILTARLNCDPDREARQMLETKRDYGKEDGVQYYHMIQSFRPGEITPELALEIAKEFASEHLPGYQTVIGVHVDKEHIHAHIGGHGLGSAAGFPVGCAVAGCGQNLPAGPPGRAPAGWFSGDDHMAGDTCDCESDLI